VDAGLEKVARYDAERAIDSLVTERVSQAAADQRAGRAGRTGPGAVWRLWSAADRLRPFRDPEVHRIDLSGVVMDIAGWGGDSRTLDWFDAPCADAIEAARALLTSMGALSGSLLTDVGRRMLRLPLPPRLARMVVAADGHLQAIRAAALLSERYLFQARTETTTSDVLSALDAWDRVPDNVRVLASQLESVAASGSKSRSMLPEATLRRAMLAAYPDRVGKRREPHSARFLMAAGTGAVLGNESGVRDAGFIIALDLKAPARANDPESRISLASAIDREWLGPTSSQVEHSIDAAGRVVARRIERYEALILAERPVEPDADRAAALLVSEWIRRTPPVADQELLRRIRFAGLSLDVESQVRTAAYGARSLADISLSATLPRDMALALERDAPASIEVPSGRRVQLEYADDGGVTASVKLQELFGLAETPRIGPRRVPVLLSLLAPNGRPVQLTRDLRSFWDRTYPEVRKELRGRYPKHPWPEDPWKAVPTHRTRGRA
jgi:ATP-dependent helicase HrpB